MPYMDEIRETKVMFANSIPHITVIVSSVSHELPFQTSQFPEEHFSGYNASHCVLKKKPELPSNWRETYYKHNNNEW